MASLELLYIDKAGGNSETTLVLEWASNPLDVHKSKSPAVEALPREIERGLAVRVSDCEGQCNSAPRTVPLKGLPGKHGHKGAEKVRVCCDEELETSFTYVDENVNLRLATPDASGKIPPGAVCHSSSCELRPDGFQEFSLMSENDLTSESAVKSVDYGFISAVTFLVTGISLVIISYSVPRDVNMDPDSVSAREMERLENESARVGAHLDRCVIAGLCLLTLGGVVLSTLLMISMWKGEMYRRKAFAYSKHSTKLYGSINFNTRASPSCASPHCSMEEVNDANDTCG
ncbi:hypothetical protein AALO_G00178020 [Alosa alosa]|uniref:Transmembrane protein 74 n=1 Tax=Alosa alosa TaxID=278164 RepID=A0AAV6G9N6_9TELE|nr:transmembrane protein 74 [Alosa alosa]KAG5271284.1 hypothetical protein AALO_G00178020 [Alosa alosa]